MEVGTRIGAYEITAKLGEGGMGEVFRARDSRLNREVALKVLPAGMAADPERLERFRREAQAVAALNHPNIVTLHSFEESGGIRFLTMELVEGAALDTLIPPGGFDLEGWLEIGAALADAVAAAHAKGIVHRDLKPANIMIGASADRRQVKVLDFGLARMAETGTDGSVNAPTLLTGDGVVMGTLPYMSPEQVRGAPLDERTDLFSLGVILYEMAAGRRPFSGGSSVELGSAILRDTPPPLAGRSEKLPPDVERILRRCLEKEPRDRIASARALYDELRLLRRDLAVGHGSSGRAPAAPADSGADRVQEGLRVAVLPFRSSGDAEMESFADGLGEEITTGLSRFRYLSVVASASAARLKGEAGDERKLGAKVGARYLLEGSLRKGGSALRVSAQLVDAETGARLWAETYNRDLQTTHLFEAQDDVAARIVATVADTYGVLVHSIRAAMRQKDDADLTPVEWQFQYFAYREQITPASHAALEGRLERALKRDQRQSELWACLAQIYVDQYAFGFGADASSLDRALAAARRAVEIDRANQFALVALAQVHFFRRDLAAFGPTAERAMALNPLNTDAIGILGLQIVHTGEFERGTGIVLRAMELNPNHAGWMHFAPLWNHFHSGEYEQALERANRVDVPGLFWPYLVVAAACGHLGRRAEAAAAIRDLLALDPDFAAHARSNIQSWHFASGLLEPLLDGLRKAGLNVPDPARAEPLDAVPVPPGDSGDPGSVDARSSATAREAVVAGPRSDSRAGRATERFWIAVLPFKQSGGIGELAALAAGLTESIVTGLSRFSYLRVISWSSTSRFAGESVDLRTVGGELGARYVMTGNLYQAGARVRIAAQLVDAETGAHLWAESYDRAFRPEEIFELQDEVAPTIVSTIADMNGVLPHAMSEAMRGKSAEELTPYEAVLRAFGYLARLDAEEHSVVTRALERAVRESPGDADGWAMLSLVQAEEFKHDFDVRPGSLDRALDSARRSVAAAPSSSLGYHMLAQALFFRREFGAFRNAAERAIALNPMDGCTVASMGILLAYAGEWERGCELTRRAMRLNPQHPGWYRFALFNDAYRRHDYREAVEVALQFNMPSYFYTHAVLASAYGQLGDSAAAKRALDELSAQKPEFGAVARRELGKWYVDDQLLAETLDGLRKAGLDVPAAARTGPAENPAAAVAIAVLPFADMSPGHDQEYLCEGMAEEIMSALVRIDGLRVAARTSAFRAHRDGGDPRAIGERLGVGLILEGSVRTAGSRLRATAQLIEVESGFQLWSERFDRETADLFAVQDEIAVGVVEAVRARLAPGARAVAARPQPANLEAYRSYLKGRSLRGKEHHAEALRAFEEAVRLDPSHAPSWTGLAEITVLAAAFGMIPPRAACATAREALATATRLQGESAEGLHVEGFVAWIERRWQAMEAAWRRAIELHPTHVLSLASFGIVLCTRQRLDEALPFFERAREADPLASFPYALTGMGYLNCGLPREAERYLEDALAFEKDDATALDSSGMAKVALGRVEEGIATLERVVAVSQRAPHFLGTLGWALATAGRTSEARTLLVELRSRSSEAPTLVSEAWLLGALGEIDTAFDVIARAEEECQAYLYFTGLPGFDPLRTDSRFAALEKRLGLTAPKDSPS